MKISIRRIGGELVYLFQKPLFMRSLIRKFLPTRYVVRPVEPAKDIDALALFCGKRGSRRYQGGYRSFRSELENLDERKKIFLVAALNQRIVGIGRAGCHGDNPDGVWWIWGLEVKPRYWGHGIGKRITEQLLGQLRDRGVEKVCLSVRKNNFPAISLYKKFGFVPESKAVSSYIKMTLPLASKRDAKLSQA